MKPVTSVLCLLVLYPFSVVLGQVTGDSFYARDPNVIELTANNFDRVIQRTNYTSLVEFYAPWCGHCQKLKPAFERVGKKLRGLTQVCAINCDAAQNKQICAEYKIEGFPTLKVFKPQKVDLDKDTESKVSKSKGRLNRHVTETYLGERKISSIVNYTLSRMKNYVKKLGRTDTMYKILDKNLANDNKRLPIILLSKNDRISPVFKAIALDWYGQFDLYSIYNQKLKTIPTGSGEFISRYPGIVKSLNEIIQGQIDNNHKESQLLILDGQNDQIIEFSDLSITKESVSKFLIEKYEMLPYEGPFSKREVYLDKIRSGQKKSTKKSIKKSSKKAAKKAEKINHDEL